MKKAKTMEEVRVANAHHAVAHAAKMFYNNPANRTRQFTLTFVDFLPEELKAKYTKVAA